MNLIPILSRAYWLSVRQAAYELKLNCWTTLENSFGFEEQFSEPRNKTLAYVCCRTDKHDTSTSSLRRNEDQFECE